LDHVHAAHIRRKTLRQRATAAAHLQHHIVGTQIGVPDDHVQEVRIGEEVLAEAAGGAIRRPGGPHHPKTLAAFASTMRSSSPYETPRTSASRSAVATTLAGSLGLPRTGWAAWYRGSV